MHRILPSSARALHTRLRSSTSPNMRPATTGATLWATDSAAAVNLGRGHPNPSLLPLVDLRLAFDVAAHRPEANVTLLQYGLDRGNACLREQIVDWTYRYAQRPAARVSPEHVLVTNGSGPTLALVCQLFSRPGDTIFVDCPGYFLAYYTFRDCGLNVVQIRTDQHGLNVDLIEQKLKQGERPALIYTVPIANNPTGVSMSETRKKKLVELSRQYAFKIASDEVYQFLTFDERLPTSLYEYDDVDKPTVFSINSFSKLIGPGLRVGWLTTNPLHIQRILDSGAIQSGGGLNPFASAIISEMIESKAVQNQVHTLRAHYQRTSTALCDAIERHIRPALRTDDVLHYYKPQGGFFCFIALPERIDSEKLLKIAKQHGVSFFTGHQFSSDGFGFQNCIRLCFAYVDEQEIVEGVRRLGDAIRNYDDTR
eukprot:TRINITY_DN188_c0_g1_i10.p3 TRINITY_DN188_c0_g1~~TRINITY_DN188_c0_g1_i10.p3  ORF type:complete len:425 (-),score=49.49 TRINITY_DN188_c0_g1_i10:5635-6909(-)